MQKIIWKYEYEDEKVAFEFDMGGMTHKDVFLMWVKFMNAIGYTLDAAEMEAMWNGEEIEYQKSVGKRLMDKYSGALSDLAKR